MYGKGVNQLGKPDLIFQQGGDVIEQDAFPGKIRHLTNELFQGLAIRAPGLHRLYHAPSIPNVVSPAIGSAGDSTTVSTRAARGPFCNFCCKAASCCSVPMASTSTVPSGLLRTQPASPS